MLRLDSTVAEPSEWQTWEITPGVAVELLLAQPTMLGRLSPGWALQSRIEDWRGVEDDQGDPVPYSWAALDRVLSTHPESFPGLQALVQDDSADNVIDRAIPQARSESNSDTPNYDVPLAAPIVAAERDSIGPASRDVSNDSEFLLESGAAANVPSVEELVKPDTELPISRVVSNATHPGTAEQRTTTRTETDEPNTLLPEATDPDVGTQQPITVDAPREPRAKSVTPRPQRSVPDASTAPTEDLTWSTSALYARQDQLQQSLDEMWRILHEFTGRGSNASRRAQFSGGGR